METSYRCGHEPPCHQRWQAGTSTDQFQASCCRFLRCWSRAPNGFLLNHFTKSFRPSQIWAISSLISACSFSRLFLWLSSSSRVSVLMLATSAFTLSTVSANIAWRQWESKEVQYGQRRWKGGCAVFNKKPHRVWVQLLEHSITYCRLVFDQAQDLVQRSSIVIWLHDDTIWIRVCCIARRVRCHHKGSKTKQGE